MQDLRPQFGARVRELRVALGLTQEQVAERADMHWTFVSGVERGVRNPGLNAIGKLAKALEVTPDALFLNQPVASRRPRPKSKRR